MPGTGSRGRSGCSLDPERRRRPSSTRSGGRPAALACRPERGVSRSEFIRQHLALVLEQCRERRSTGSFEAPSIERALVTFRAWRSPRSMTSFATSGGRWKCSCEIWHAAHSPTRRPTLDQLTSHGDRPRYSDLGLGLVDGSVVALAEGLGIRRVATRDARHFAAVRLGDGSPFELAVHPRDPDRS